MDGNYSLADIASLLLETVEIMTACLAEMVAGGLLFYSFLLSLDGETTAGAIMAMAADMRTTAAYSGRHSERIRQFSGNQQT